MRRLAALLFFLALASPVAAQTAPNPGCTAAWDPPNVGFVKDSTRYTATKIIRFYGISNAGLWVTCPTVLPVDSTAYNAALATIGALRDTITTLRAAPPPSPAPVDSAPTTPPPATGSYPNRPTSYTKTLAEFTASYPVPVGTNYELYISGAAPWSMVGNSNVTLQSDPTAGGSPPGVWRVYEPKGTYGGGVPGTGSSTGFGRWGLPINSPSVYGSVWVKWSPGFWFHTTSQKFIRMDMVGASQAFLIQASHNSDFLRSSDEQAGIGIEPQISTLPSTGVWHQIEFVAVRGTSGSLRVWLDGQLRVSYNGRMATTGNFATFELHSEMGGGGMVLPADQWFMVDHLLVAGP